MIKKHVVTSKQTKILKEKLNNLSLFTSIQLFLVDIFFIQKLYQDNKTFILLQKIVFIRCFIALYNKNIKVYE